MYEITFQFENGAQEVHFSAAPGSTILEAAKAANVAIDAPCNGNGSCGTCRVKLISGDVPGMQTGHISDADYAAGWRLGCATKPAGDITVLVPDIASAYQSRMKTADLSSGEEIAIFNQLQEDVQAAGVDFTNDFVQALVELDEPTLDDTMPDTERLERFAQDAFDEFRRQHRQRFCSLRNRSIRRQIFSNTAGFSTKSSVSLSTRSTSPS